MMEELKRAINEVLDERGRIDAETHHIHHDYVAQLIERERMRKERNEKVRTHVIGWGMVTALSGLVYLIFEGFKDWIKLIGSTHR